MARLFGTDGVRGTANKDLTAELALDLGVAAARLVHRSSDKSASRSGKSGEKPTAIVGRDTRISGEFLDLAVSAGLASAGMDVNRIGVVTTPTVAELTAEMDVDLGVMISASHNPMQDNGIKFFARGGYKLPDETEDRIAELLGASWDRPTGDRVGEIQELPKRAETVYIEHLLKSADTDLSGMKIVLDCANGGASRLGPEALREAGAEVVVINASPDGRNINVNSGSTHPEQLQSAVVASGADLGFAYDGDADRCLAVDHCGMLVDGDQIMGMLAVSFKENGVLDHDTLVVTVMSNLGLILAMKEKGIKTVQTAVGDRYVLERMLADGYKLGGEQSGHVIDGNHATTGDGILTSLLVSRAVQDSGRPLAELVSFIKHLPQTLINVPDVDKSRVTEDPGVADAVRAAQRELGETGRVLLRPSGTEPLVRVMVEAAEQSEADSIAARLADVVRERLAL
ncbi:MAG: phosphoglucosamine mutase [Varibaculum sp.]|nr:phosphoglucosamine mutase [Varibaculum sp.]